MGVDYLEGFAVNIQANEDAYFVDGFEGVMKVIKTAGAEIANQDVEELYILEGLSETVEQG